MLNIVHEHFVELNSLNDACIVGVGQLKVFYLKFSSFKLQKTVFISTLICN